MYVEFSECNMQVSIRLQFPFKHLLQNGLAQAGNTLEVGGHTRGQLLHHAQQPLHFQHSGQVIRLPQDGIFLRGSFSIGVSVVHHEIEASCRPSGASCLIRQPTGRLAIRRQFHISALQTDGRVIGRLQVGKE